MLRRTVRKAANALLNPFGLELTRTSMDLDALLAPGNRRDMLFHEAASHASTWLEGRSIFPTYSNFDVEKEVRAFFEDYMISPFRNPNGGSRFGNLLWLNLLAKAAAPDVIVDSGSFRGGSAWALRRGSPASRVLSFDIDLSQLLLRVPGVEYIQSDWMDFPFSGEDILCYFDDHIDQCRRLRESAARRVSVAVFDDDFSISQFPPMAHGGFSLPKLSFCFDDTLEDGEVIAWNEGDVHHEWIVPKTELEAVRALIARYERLPDISIPFGIDQLPYSIALLRKSAGSLIE